MFYEVNQNNSGGSFDVDDKVCHRLFIEANSEKEALEKAEELGCYWYGVAEGIDCPCCGDRWSTYLREISLTFNHYVNDEEDSIEKYTPYARTVGEICVDKNGSNYIPMEYNSLEEYAQYLADDFGWTSPDVRIYYLDGTVKEIFTKKEIKEKRENGYCARSLIYY